ncbi:pituitary tumor-transforming gene 1 protein-interacting protein-like isoform X2 [Stylophora pistillata]|uniref:pituitary tumor-transforming gene 1 protein-interacting protein-like isoform X2 n=1 Tax=Stylophora pistillata TaxID=50429 RepID=UPI000C03E842|nr:pituitary tumor-transforming gene 1 protein-interacting protein-like isoform X2 [Stylophora pistillata]
MNLLQKALLAVSAVVYLGSRIICGQTTNSTLACSAAKNCEKCVEDSKCFWCETTLLCNDYGVENEKVETKKCDRWKWKTCVLIVLVCMKRDLWNRMRSSRFCDERDKEGLFEQEERFIRKKKHTKKLGKKAQNLADKYKLNDSSMLLYTP